MAAGFAAGATFGLFISAATQRASSSPTIVEPSMFRL